VQLVIAMAVLAALSYLAATIGAPLVDQRLVQLDAVLGFDWDSAAQWVGQRPILDRVLRYAYDSIAVQPAVLILMGSLTRPSDRNSEAIWLFIITLLLACVIFAFTPALGKIGHVGTGYLKEIAELRSGNWSVLSYSRVEGIITFPSFHTTLALIFIYLARHNRWVLATFVPLNIVMILSIPTVGGHYLIDLFGGAAVAAISIPIVRTLRQHIAARRNLPHLLLAGLQTGPSASYGA
jgi:membrane-associated phospholipid phosphatase